VQYRRGTILRSFAADVSDLIKSIDPNHLVSLGTMGGGQCGAQGAEYQSVHDPPSIDFCEYHDYSPDATMPGDQWNGLQVRLDQCAILNKPLLVDETGIRPSDVGGSLQARVDAFRAKFTAQFNAGVVGELVWAWDKDGSTLDNYDVGPGDPVLTLLAAFRSGVPSIPLNGQLAFCHGSAISPQSGKFVINDATCVVNFFIGPQDGSWTSAVLESSSDGGLSWQSNGDAFPNVNLGQTAGSAIGPCNEFGLGVRAFRAHGTLTTIGGDIYSAVFPVAVDIQSCAAGGSTRQTASGGATITTDPGNLGATAGVPVQTQVTLPVSAGTMTVSITAQPTTGSSPSGFGFFGTQVVIDNGGISVSPDTPYVLRFTVDASALAGVAPADVQVFRDGLTLADCTDPTAAIPDGACVASRSPGPDGDAITTVRTDHFSKWNVGRVVYNAGSFLEPVDNLPVVNSGKAGSSIPVKFRLGGNRGLNIFQAGYPAQKSYVCGSAPVDTLEQTVTATVSGLSYDPASDMYTYVWKTDKTWASTCRELTLKFRDGSSRVARFTFTR
jgi:hypothetical protein